MEKITFHHETHRRFYYRMLRQAGDRKNPAVRALFYLLGIGKETRNHINELYDFKRKQIYPEALHAPWQTDQSIRATLAAFHLWNGHTNKGDAHLISPHALFSGPFANLYAEAIKLRYPDFFGQLEKEKP